MSRKGSTRTAVRIGNSPGRVGHLEGEQQRAGVHQGVDEMVLWYGQAVEAELLGQYRLLDHVGVEPLGRIAGVRVVA